MAGRRSASKKEEYNFKKSGAYGQFVTDASLPIEYLLTTFNHKELSFLTYARDLRSEKNFELMIQRDIDEERAVDQISEYLKPKEKENIVFLPPLIAAVVGVDNEKAIEPYYPESSWVEDKDELGDILIREWQGVFKIINYPQEDGYPLVLDEHTSRDIDPTQAELQISHSEDDKGARLVVIDGQHRLFALNELKKNGPKDALKRVLLPVCILFSPKSSRSYEKNDAIPKVHEILRHLFIDVNETVERVSGHFTILLSDQTIGGLVCRAFCSQVLMQYGGEGLALVEWNTKSHKEAKTISKKYTVTSIGVINEALKDYFKNKKTKETLYFLLGMVEQDAAKLFEPEDEDEQISIPSDFPWSGFSYAQKPFLDDKVKEFMAPLLVKLFFEIKEFKKIYEIFKSNLATHIELPLQESGTNTSFIKAARLNILEGKPISTSNSEEIRDAFIDKVQKQISSEVRTIVRTKVFQKALMDGFFDFVSNVKYSNAKIETILNGYIDLIDYVFDKRVDIFRNDDTRTYMQVSIYDGVTIRPTAHCVSQIKRLILAPLGGAKLSQKISARVVGEDPKIDCKKLSEILSVFGTTEAAQFNDERFEQVYKTFVIKYKNNYSLSSEVRDSLQAAEAAYKEAAKQGADSEQQLADFRQKVLEQVRDDNAKAKMQLDSVLNFKSGSLSLDEAYDEIED